MATVKPPNIPGRIGQESICWHCRHAVPSKDKGCEWSKHRRPVEGWVSKDTMRTRQQTIKKYSKQYTAHKVQACPKFERG